MPENTQKKLPPMFQGPDKVTKRRTYVAARLMGDGRNATAKLLAEELGVHIDTVYDDLNSPELIEITLKELTTQIKGMGIASAWKNIHKAIINGDIHISKWILERCIFDTSVVKGESREDIEDRITRKILASKEKNDDK